MIHNLRSDQCFGIKDSVLGQIFDRCNWNETEKPLLAGKLKSETEYVIIVIPLWFNVVTTVLVFTTDRILIATKTLWRGVTEVAEIAYSDLYSLVVVPRKKKFMYVTSAGMNSKITLRLNNGNLIELATTNHTFAAAVAETIGEHVQLLVEE